MDQSSLVEQQISDGSRIVEKLRESGFDVVAAWWMKPTELGRWLLYIASKSVDQNGTAAGYGAVHTAMRELGELSVDRFGVRLIGSEHPATKDVLEIQSKYPAQTATRFRAVRLGHVTIDGSYIYPALVTA